MERENQERWPQEKVVMGQLYNPEENNCLSQAAVKTFKMHKFFLLFLMQGSTGFSLFSPLVEKTRKAKVIEFVDRWKLGEQGMQGQEK